MNGNLYVSCPHVLLSPSSFLRNVADSPLRSLHKRNYRLDTGDCINDDEYKVMAFEAKEENGDILLRLPPSDDLDSLIGTSQWMVRKATAQALGKNLATALEIVGPSDKAVAMELRDEAPAPAGVGACGSGSSKLEW